MMTIVDATVDATVDAACLTFEQIRVKCFNHITSLPNINIKHVGRCDAGELREELINIIEDLETSKIKYEDRDLTNAFYSAIFEIEYGQIFLPNALIAPKSNVFVTNGKIQIGRLLRFGHDYPFVSVSFYKNDGSFDLRKDSNLLSLKDFHLVLSIDPLINRRLKHGALS
jgi:hypothetical protein